MEVPNSVPVTVYTTYLPVKFFDDSHCIGIYYDWKTQNSSYNIKVTPSFLYMQSLIDDIILFLSRWDRRFLSDWLRSSFDLIFLGYLYPVVDKVWTRKCVVLSGRIPPRLLAVFIVVSKVCLRLVLCFVSFVQV